MALTKELLKVLDDDQEPFPKRLKIADNAFKSAELPIQHREAVLLRWLGTATEEGSHEAWNLLLSWLKSQQMQDLNRNDISQEDIRHLMIIISKNVKSTAIVSIVINCFIALIENRNFNLFVKFDLDEYCTFISSVLVEISDADLLYRCISNEQLYNRSIISHDEFYKYFIANNLEDLGRIVEKFKDDERIFRAISKLIEKCLFHRNFKTFLAYAQFCVEVNKQDDTVDNKPPPLPKLLIKTMRSIYKNDQCPKYVFKLILHGYCSSYSSSFEAIYKFFIVLSQSLGFDLVEYFNMSAIKAIKHNSLEKSLPILTELCQVLANNRNELGCKVNEKTFSEFLQNLTLTVISLTKQPDRTCYEFLTYIIKLDPLIIERILNEVLVYTMLSNKKNSKPQYEKFMVATMEVFVKLHRVPNLISKMTRVLKVALVEDFKPTSSSFGFCGTCSCSEQASNIVITDMFSPSILSYFTQCITSLASWQVINLFKTLFFHLEEAVKDDLPAVIEATEKVIYMEIVSTLMCQFLLSVRIAEHTVTTAVVEKFVKSMDELKDVLGRFGTALVNIEHNPILMRTYLNICYAWGELYITLAYYSINDEVVLQKNVDSDSSACNITYLHPYLTRDQWCLIAQRITNFGEKPCKLIMHKLYIQKLKAMLLFEESVNEDVTTAIRTGVFSMVEEYWEDLILDHLALEQIITKSNNIVRISELILQDVVENRDFKHLELLFDHQELVGSMLYTTLVKLNKCFKQKKKRNSSLASRIFPYVTADLFLDPKQASEGVQQLTEVFLQELNLVAERPEVEMSSINEKDVSSYFDVIQAIPIVQCDFLSIHEALIVYLLSVLVDLKAMQNVVLVRKCESIIIGLAQNFLGSFKALIQPFSTTQIIIDTFERYSDIFACIIQNIFRNEEDIELLKPGIEHLSQKIERERYLHCTTLVLNCINKNKKSKHPAHVKALLVTYQEGICKSIAELVKKHEDLPDVVELVEAYALALKYYLAKDSDEGVKQLLPYLGNFVTAILSKSDQSSSNIRGSLLLLTSIMHNKSKLKEVQEDFVFKAWKYCQNLSTEAREDENYSKLVTLVFGHIPSQQFSTISMDLLKLASQVINEDPKQFSEQLKIWNAILGCDFNPEKTEMWQKTLESLLLETVLMHLQDKQSQSEDVFEHIVKFEINIIQNSHLLLTGPLVEAMLITASVIISSTSCTFLPKYKLSIALLEALLKHRKALMMDYLPTYLQRYRALLNVLCAESNSDKILEASKVQHLADCAHKLEKLTNVLVSFSRPMVRLSPYLIAEILKQYEEVTLYPNVKIHLNNCLYSLVTLCDQHAISYLMRILSTASTEMFKVMFENYKKYYKYTGKV